MTSRSSAAAFAHFMGFRNCPVCGEALFAAESAAFVRADQAALFWRCDTCEHSFQTLADIGTYHAEHATAA